MVSELLLCADGAERVDLSSQRTELAAGRGELADGAGDRLVWRVSAAMNYGGKKSKHEVDYSEGMGETRCGNCAHYRGELVKAFGGGSCVKVWGIIDSMMWCNLFEKRGS